jgi:hypothetical protein
MTVPNNTYGDIDWDDPSTFTIKHLPDPTAWNGLDWLTEGSTPEEIEAMRQMAIDDAHQLDMGIEPVSRFPPLERPGEQALEAEIEDETARDEAAQASRERQPADIEVQTPIQIEEVDPENGKRIPNACTPTSRGKVTTGNQPKRGDVVLSSVDVLSGPNEKGQYVLEFYDDFLRHCVEFTSTLPNDAQIFPPLDEEIDDERGHAARVSGVAQRGDVVLFPFTVVGGLDHRGFYDVIVHDEWQAEIMRLMTHPPKDIQRAGLIRLTAIFPSDIQIIDHVEVSDAISGE